MYVHNGADTNRYGVTSKFKPLITVIELDPSAQMDSLHHADTLHHAHRSVSEEEHGENNDNKDVANGKTPDKQLEHRTEKIQNSVLPGIFWVYEIHPFTVSVSAGRVKTPLSHLLLRLIAVIGGVITVGGWIDKLMLLREKKNGSKAGLGLGGEISTEGLIGLRRN